MKVFNLTDQDLDYRGQVIPPNGGFREYPDLTFIPTRDQELENKKVVAFGRLPSWWLPVIPQPIPVPVPRPRLNRSKKHESKVSQKLP